MYRNEAFTEGLYVDLWGVSLDSLFGESFHVHVRYPLQK